MKKFLQGVAIFSVVLLMSGCGSAKEVVKTCTLTTNNTAQDYKLEAEYKVYGKGKIVEKVVTTETVTSSTESILTYFEEYLNNSYKTLNDTYGGYTGKITNKDGKVVSETTIDYSKLDLDKFIKDNSAMKNYVNSDNKILVDGVIELYESLGATCN